MEVIIQPTADDAANLTARLIAHALRANPRLVLGLATGRTMEAVYAALVQMHVRDGLDFSGCRTFNLDEYVGLTPDDPCSYRYYMHERLFRHVNIVPAQTYLPDGMAPDLDAACRRYEAEIQRAGGVDFQLLGIGHDGHIGFNEPLSALRSRTRAVTLAPQTVAANAPLFDDPARMPRQALTMGVETILACRRCLLLATGSGKAEILAQALEGPLCAMVTASALQLHPHCTIIADEDAAVHLAGQEYYRYAFAHDPQWAPFR